MNNNFKRLTWFVAIMTGTLSLSAQTTHNLSLNEAIELSLRNSSQLKLSRNKIDEATATLKSAREQRLPDASISGSYLRLNQPNVDLKLKLGDQQQSNNSSSGEEQANTSSAAFLR